VKWYKNFFLNNRWKKKQFLFILTKPH
jgi:hypothetical protein